MTLKSFPIEALVAIVNRETAILNENFHKYGEHQWNPQTPALSELNSRFEAAKGAKDGDEEKEYTEGGSLIKKHGLIDGIKSRRGPFTGKQ